MAYASAKSISKTEIPVIDIGPLRDGSDAQAVARGLAWAIKEIGFIYVSNHGVPQTVIDTAREAGLRFFNLSPDEKLKAITNKSHHGYLRPGATKMYDDARVDLKESFNWGIELHAAALEKATDNPLLGPNVWPEHMPEFKTGVYSYFESASACAVDLLRAFAMAAGLAEDTFIKHADRPISRGSLQYYPPQPPELGEEQFGVAPHTDFGMLTVLCQDDVGGLQLQDLAGDWVAVPPIPGTLVVNVGDLLGRWSNGHFRSTPHRVINSSGRQRLSLVLAYDPNYETLVDPSVFCAEGEAPRNEPITCGDYLMWRFKKAFAYRE